MGRGERGRTGERREEKGDWLRRRSKRRYPEDGGGDGACPLWVRAPTRNGIAEGGQAPSRAVSRWLSASTAGSEPVPNRAAWRRSRAAPPLPEGLLITQPRATPGGPIGVRRGRGPTGQPHTGGESVGPSARRGSGAARQRVERGDWLRRRSKRRYPEDRGGDGACPLWVPKAHTVILSGERRSTRGAKARGTRAPRASRYG